ncbi:MAG: DUF4351 domain-containing protein [Magnetococcales bacterium]|nr:DUF4351 domain-containing protein [Magnetococcales bacterium]
MITLPPKVDIVFIQRKEHGRTEEQRMLLADGLRDLDVDHILAELKITESLNEETLSWVSMYDTLYRDTINLKRHQLRSVIISAITPRREYLERYAFEPVGPSGVYVTESRWGDTVRLVLLNELSDESHNAPLKCFASRREEQEKAFATIKVSGLFKISDSFSQITAGLWRLIMRSALNNPEMEGITPEYVMQLGKEWFESMVEATPDGELFSLPKFEHRLVQEHRDGEKKGRQEEAASMLTRQLQRRFGNLPAWASEKIANADLSTLEEWSLRILDATTIESVFADPP